jgi:hypothetical protein
VLGEVEAQEARKAVPIAMSTLRIIISIFAYNALFNGQNYVG